MPYAFFGVTLFGLVLVANAVWPIRREPLTVPSFFAGWLVGELAFQHIVWQVGATVAFAFAGALSGWAGWAGLGFAVCGWIGLAWLAVVGVRTGKVITAGLATARNAPFLRGVDLASPAWSRWWRQAIAVPLHGRKIERIKNVDYWGDGIRRHRLDVVRPRGTTPHGAPVLVQIHGGAWVMGDKREQGNPLMNELAARGWVCVAINYRLGPRAAWPAEIIDCKRAIAWVKSHIDEYGGDPSFVALTGGSAGGHLSALAALTPGYRPWQPGFEDADTEVQACVPFYGVYDMTGSAGGSGAYGPGLVRMLERLVMKTDLSGHREVFEEASPTLRVTSEAPPFLVLHGTNDTLVPVDVARVFVEALREVSRAAVVYAELPLAQHAFDVLVSPRCGAAIAGATAFLEALRSRHRDAASAGGGPGT